MCRSVLQPPCDLFTQQGPSPHQKEIITHLLADKSTLKPRHMHMIVAAVGVVAAVTVVVVAVVAVIAVILTMVRGDAGDDGLGQAGASPCACEVAAQNTPENMPLKHNLTEALPHSARWNQRKLSLCRPFNRLRNVPCPNLKPIWVFRKIQSYLQPT